MLAKRSERRREEDLGRLIAVFESDTREVEVQPDPPLARATLWVLALMVLAVGIWASVSSMDRMVTSRGTIVSVEPSVVVQPLETSIVKQLKVDVGDVVRAGQSLATLDPTFVQADVSQIQSRLRSTNAQIARIEVEMADSPYAPTDTAANPDSLLQMSIWRERKTQYEAQLRSYDQKIASLQAAISGRMSDQVVLTQRLKVLSEIEKMRERLAQADVGSKLNVLLASDARLEVNRNLELANKALVEAQHELDSYKAQREVFIGDWRNKTMAELVTARNEQGNLTEQLVKARKRGDLVNLESPVDAIVLERSNRSIGSVVKEAEPLFTLVPLNSVLEAEVMIDARDIGFVRAGDPVALKIDAYNYMEHGTVEGEIRTITEDSFRNKQEGAVGTQTGGDAPASAFYRARVRLKSTTLKDVPEGFRIIPGLTLQADIKVGTRTVISYLLRPLLRGLGEAMREP